MSAACVCPRSAADCLIRSALEQGNPRTGSFVTSDPIRGVIVSGLGAGEIGGLAILRCPLASNFVVDNE